MGVAGVDVARVSILPRSVVLQDLYVVDDAAGCTLVTGVVLSADMDSVATELCTFDELVVLSTAVNEWVKL